MQFFQAAVISILLYGSTTWMLSERMKKKLDGNYTRMLCAILNKSWKQHPTKQQLFGHLWPIMKTIQIRGTKHVKHCWRSKDELLSNVVQWIPPHGRAKVGRPARNYIQELCANTWCSLEDLPGVMDNRDEWWERVKEIHAIMMMRIYIYTYTCIYILDMHMVSFQTFFIWAFKIDVTLENSVCYCYTSYEMTGQFLWLQVRMNSFSRNWNTPF